MEEITQQTVQPEPQPDAWRFFAELVKTAVIVIFLAYFIRLFVLQPFIVEGSSMDPKFHTNDYLLVDKISYRFEQPARGDIVVFRYPLDPSVNYVKRIIGLPGERVKIDEGGVMVFNDANPNGFRLDEPYVATGRKTLPSTAGQADFIVPKDSFYVLGDNRPASSDSREWRELPKSDIIGRAIVQAYPFNRFSLITHAQYDGK